MTTHELTTINKDGERFIAIKPLPIQVVPVDGQLTVIVDPVAVLANPDGPDMVAHLLRALGMAQDMEILIYGKCIADALARVQLPPGHGYMFDMPVCRNRKVSK